MSATREALRALGTREASASTLPPSLTQRAVDQASSWLRKRTSRRGFLLRAGVVGTALAVDPTGYALRPGTAYASVCGPGASCSSGWTVFCATINAGVNACPPGSVAAGWWKADGASLCGGGARYIIDCNATCATCSTPGTRAGICSTSCWSCSCTCGPSNTCDQRRVCCNGFRYGQCNTQIRQVGGVHCRVVSCTPPWRFANCSTATATDNRTRDHSSAQLPGAFTVITRRYMALGENGSALGATVYGEFPVAGGRVQRYQHGRISYSAATGARETIGPISQRFLLTGAEPGALGFPTSYRFAVTGGFAQYFQRGRISFSEATGARETLGPIMQRFVLSGAEPGVLGFPTSYRFAVTGGFAQYFQRGRISFSEATGAWDTRGEISRRFVLSGAEPGVLGFPVGTEQEVPDGEGRFSLFERGRISYRSDLGAFYTRGPIAEEYAELGAETSDLGYPVADEVQPRPGLRRSEFEHGAIEHDETTGETTVQR